MNNWRTETEVKADKLHIPVNVWRIETNVVAYKLHIPEKEIPYMF